MVVDPPVPQLETDPVLLERVVANLVDNALLHGAGRAVRVEAGAVAGRVDIRIIDHGPGIRAADRDLVFRPFQRLGDSANRTGVGLGLAVSRGFVEAVGGDLDLEDTPGGGCTLVVRLPGARGPHASIIDASCDEDVIVPDDAARPDATPGPRRGRMIDPLEDRAGARVLVIDDDPSLLRALTISLGARGYEVAGARTGEDGLDKVAHWHPDLVLVDLGLPGIDGVEVIRGVRGWSEVPILVLSARHQSTGKVEALDLGADDYVTKPFGMDELLARIRAALRRAPGAEQDPRVEAEGFTVELDTKRVVRDGDRGAPDPEGVGHRRGPGPQPGPPGVPAPAPPGGVGTPLRDRDGVPAGAHGTGPPQARGRPLTAAALHHRARHGLPLRALIQPGDLLGPSALRIDRTAPRRRPTQVAPEVVSSGPWGPGGGRRRPSPSGFPHPPHP